MASVERDMAEEFDMDVEIEKSYMSALEKIRGMLSVMTSTGLVTAVLIFSRHHQLQFYVNT